MNLDRLSEAMRDGIGKASAPDIEEERGRTRIDELSGAANTGQDTSESAAESTKTGKRKVDSLHKSSLLIDHEGKSTLSKGYQQDRKTFRIAKHT
jgi:hypothetical protein